MTGSSDSIMISTLSSVFVSIQSGSCIQYTARLWSHLIGTQTLSAGDVKSGLGLSLVTCIVILFQSIFA